MNENKDNTADRIKELLAWIFAPRVTPNRLPPGRCSCHEHTVRWCTRHGRPLGSALHPR